MAPFWLGPFIYIFLLFFIIIFFNLVVKGNFSNVPQIGLKSLNSVHHKTFIWNK